MKKKIINGIIYTIVFLVYYLFPYACNYILELFNVDLSKFGALFIILFLLILEIVPVLFLVFIYRKDLKEEFKLYIKTFTKNFDNYIRLWIFALILMSVSNMLISIFTESEISNNEEAIRDITNILPIYSLFTTCICAPIGEELAYRKTIGNIFPNKKLAIFASGLVFGLAHVIGTYTGLIDLLYVFPYGLFGAVFMYMYLSSKNIWSTISIHFIHNTLLMIVYFIK